MASTSSLLILWVLLAAAGITAVAAQCEEGEDSSEDTNSSGCIKCSVDKSRCEICTRKWVLTAAGQCAKCNATHIGGWQESCVSCRADDPAVCLKCEDYCNTNGCTGYYVTRDGHCSRCPVGAAACDDLSGKIQECRAGKGLVGGECRQCKVTGCQACDGDLWTCTKCIIQRAYFADGYFPDPLTRACVRCDKGCKACTGTGGCLECALTVLDPITKTCLPCSVPNCFQCSEALDKCSECVKGLRPEGGSTCVPCGVANCQDCPESDRCRQCRPGYGLADRQDDSFDELATACHSCDKPDPNCLSCDGNPAVCSKCAEGMGLDTGTGLCIPCQLADADSGDCSNLDATRCDEDSQCATGFYCRNTTGQCIACPAQGCLTCDSQDPNVCSLCRPGWWDAARPTNEQLYRASPSTDQSSRWASFQDLATECQPCGSQHCLVCDLSLGATCERCADGYFLDSTTKLCRPCTEPEGAWYETCAPAPAPAPAPEAA